jgi:hypothetical protein
VAHHLGDVDVLVEDVHGENLQAENGKSPRNGAGTGNQAEDGVYGLKPIRAQRSITSSYAVFDQTGRIAPDVVA